MTSEAETDGSFQHPWERLSLESDQAWAAFQTYRNLGRKRGNLLPG